GSGQGAGRRHAPRHPRRRGGAARLSGGQRVSELLSVSGRDCFYGGVQVLHGLELALRKGEILCLRGRNGAGKTTTLKAIMGLVRPRAGSIRMGGVELTGRPAHEVPKQGIGYVPQGRRLFAEMTVREN